MPDKISPVLKINDLFLAFPAASGSLAAVRQLRLEVPAGKVSCLVGESGCGKSLTCRAILRLAPAGSQISGEILFRGENLLTLSEKKLRAIRGASIGMIFQEPMTSLNPVLTIGRQCMEPLRLHLKMSKKDARAKTLDLFKQVGIPDPENRIDDYPHQLSGGMRQRVMIAMAIACGPALLLADEPTTALDATIQGQILRLLLEMSRQEEMALLLITHDLGVVADMADFVSVMYAGLLVETATAQEIFTHPLHPYTKALLACAPGESSWKNKRLPTIPGTVPALDEMPPGCPFAPRCPDAMQVCQAQIPPLLQEDKHSVACWLYKGKFTGVYAKTNF